MAAVDSVADISFASPLSPKAKDCAAKRRYLPITVQEWLADGCSVVAADRSTAAGQHANMETARPDSRHEHCHHGENLISAPSAAMVENA